MKKILGIIVLSIVVSLINAGGYGNNENNNKENNTANNLLFDYTNEIAEYDAKNSNYTTPNSADIGVKVQDENGATGVVLVASHDETNTTDYYLNALVAGNRLKFIGKNITSATSQIGNETKVDLAVSGCTFSLVPEMIDSDTPIDQVIEVTMADGTVYNVHTVNEMFPDFEVTYGSTPAASGVYTCILDQFMFRISTDGEIVYYRNMQYIGHNMSGNFKAQDTKDGRFYTFNLELNSEMGHKLGSFCSGMFVIMNENYVEINYATLLSSSNHGEGYLDEHEFQLLGANHWISLSYVPLLAENLNGNGIDGGNTAYVQAGIIQEVSNGKVVSEFNSIDHPELYANSLESNAYSDSTNETPDTYQDYVHINSVSIDPKDDNLLVSMRNQYAVFKIDRYTSEILWTLGGTGNDFTGLDNYLDSDCNLFIGQHHISAVDSAITGNENTISVFDNHTNTEVNLSRTCMFTLDEENMTANVEVIDGSDMDKLTGKNHWTNYCGSVEYQSKTSVVTGWGMNFLLDADPSTNGMITHPQVSDYNPVADTITFELCASRSIYSPANEPLFFSYRIYKNVD
ncbi:MAG: aryl-sulfate sulfotransferase [Clostridiales bacterium]